MAYSKDTVSGLERLQALAVVHIKQKRTAFTGNKYVVTAHDGEVLFDMKEDGSALTFFLDGSSRSFHIDAVDSEGRKVFSLRRPYEFMSDKVEVSLHGRLVSVVRKEQTLMKPVFSINDANDTPALRIKGDCVDYEFKTTTKKTIGSISKKFGGLMKEVLTYADNYVIRFPVDLDARYKAAVIGACILIDYRYHES